MLINVQELLLKRAQAPPMKFIWGGIKDVSFGFFFGAAKTGKTIVLENFLLALAKGDDEFWGLELPGKPVKTLFVSCEEYVLNRAERMEKQLSTFSKVDRALIKENYLLNDENFPTYFTSQSDWDELEQLIKDSGAKVVVVDSLSRLADNIEKRDEAKQAAQKLRKLAYDFGITIIVIHHSVKSSGTLIDQSLMAGSAVLSAEADFVYGLKKTSKGERFLKEVDLRYKEESSEEVQVFEIDSNTMIVPKGSVEEFFLLKERDKRYGSSVQDDILAFINSRKEAKTSEILNHFMAKDIPERTVKYSLQVIAKAQMVNNDKRGLYKSNL